MWRARVMIGTAALALCGLVAVAGAAHATQPAGQPAPWPEVLTLEEAARYLRVSPAVLIQLADWQQVPARRVAGVWRFSRAALHAWLAGDWPARMVAAPPGTVHEAPGLRPTDPYYAYAAPPGAWPLPPTAMARVTATGRMLAQSEARPPTPEEAPEEPIGEAPEERTAEEVFLRGQRVLLAPGEVNLDLGLFYSQSDDRQLALVNGGVGLATVEDDTFTTLLIARYGLFEETELFASTTFRDQQSDLLFGSQKLSDSSRTEFGDVRLGLRRTVLWEGPGLPDVIVTVDGRIPTGDSSYAVGGGLALVKSVDPAVLFASVNYRHTFSRDFADVTRLEAEDRIDATLGYALALNDTLTLSTAVSGLFTGASGFDNAKLRQQELFSLEFGLTSWLAEGLYIEPTVSFGLNGPGDSFALGVTLPYTFGP
jgi:excisionase family DNA binding protein